MNLGEDFVTNLTKDEEEWLCLVCNPKPVSALTTAMEACIANSMYSISFKKPSSTTAASGIKSMLESNKMILELENTGDEFAALSDSDSDGELEENVARLTTVLSYISDIDKMLQSEHLEIKKQEIREEYIEDNKEMDMNTMDQLVTEEIAHYKSLYERQHDILSRQEADLEARLAYKGYHLSSRFTRDAEAGVFDRDDEDGTVLMKEGVQADAKVIESEIDQKEEDRGIIEENEISRIAAAKKEQEGWEESLLASETMTVEEKAGRVRALEVIKLRNLEIPKKTECSYEWTEKVVEIPVDDEILKALTEKARLDEIVIECGKRKDICLSRYPPSFEQVLPRGVLKALGHTIRSSNKFKKLCKVYKVPPHIAIVMAFTKSDFGGSSFGYPCAPFIHPSVLKALRSTEVPADYEVIMIILIKFFLAEL
jgi:hypothetical protein